MRRACLVAATAVLAWACGPVDGEDRGVESASAQLATGARICSWNIRRLGWVWDGQPKDVGATATVIEQNCDVVAVQEVMMKGGAPGGYNDLSAALGNGWSGVITATPQPDDPVISASEHYAFFVRTSRATFCSDWSGIKKLSDEEGTFKREPAWTCVKVDGRERELLLVTYHATFTSTQESYREVGALDDDLNHDGLRNDVVRAVHASRNSDHDVIVVGDCNLVPSDIAEVLPTWADRTTGAGSTLNKYNEITDNLYDHVLVPADQPSLSALEPATVLDVRSVVPDNKFFDLVSDHLPIRFTLPD